ncbi:MAG: hypothetical protein V4494_03565 [Chlamydiota bacterium]
MRKGLFLIILLLLYPLVSHFCVDKTDGFTLNYIQPTITCECQIDTSLPDLSIFKQKFYYLGCGGQSYVFLSNDGQFVLKFIKNYLYFPLPIFNNFSFFHKKKNKMVRDLKSYKIAFEELSHESGLIYFHLGKTTHLLPEITISDKLGIEHKITLNEKHFILQKKADLLYPHLNALMNLGDLDGAKKAISSLLILLKTRLNKGIYDEDAKLHRNCGFIGNKALFIDIGRFCKSSKTQTLTEMTERLKLWLQNNYPELGVYLENEINR